MYFLHLQANFLYHYFSLRVLSHSHQSKQKNSACVTNEGTGTWISASPLGFFYLIIPFLFCVSVISVPIPDFYLLCLTCFSTSFVLLSILFIPFPFIFFRYFIRVTCPNQSCISSPFTHYFFLPPPIFLLLHHMLKILSHMQEKHNFLELFW